MQTTSARTQGFSIGRLQSNRCWLVIARPPQRIHWCGLARRWCSDACSQEHLRNRAGSLHDPSTNNIKTRAAIMKIISTFAIVAVATSALQGAVFANEADNVIHNRYDGITNDLLTAGLGAAGIGSPVPPGFVDPLNPTAEELRRSAIYNNYRALVDPTPGGGYGTLYGPNVKTDGTVTA